MDSPNIDPDRPRKYDFSIRGQTRFNESMPERWYNLEKLFLDFDEALEKAGPVPEENIGAVGGIYARPSYMVLERMEREGNLDGQTAREVLEEPKITRFGESIDNVSTMKFGNFTSDELTILYWVKRDEYKLKREDRFVGGTFEIRGTVIARREKDSSTFKKVIDDIFVDKPCYYNEVELQMHLEE